MSQILTGNLFKLLYSDDPANTLPIGTGVNEITNLSAMPTLQINSNQLNYETYDSTYNTVLLSNKSISAFEIVVNYVPTESSTVYLDSKLKSRDAFQVILNYRQTDGTVDYAIVAGYITGSSTTGSKDEVVRKAYTFTPEEQVVALRSIAALEPLYQGNYGVGSNGDSVPQYQPLTPEGNSFIKVPSSQAGNPAGADMLGVGLVDSSSTCSLAMTKAGTLSLYAKNTNTAWTRILTATQIASQYVPITRTVNGKALSGDITITNNDLGAMPIDGGTFTGAVTIPTLTLTTALPVTSGGTGSNTPITAAYNIGALPLRGEIGTTPNINSFGPTSGYIGVWGKLSSVGATIALGYPEDGAVGMLEVFPYNQYNGMQRYTIRGGKQYIRNLTLAWNGTDGPWTEWYDVSKNSLKATPLPANTDLNTLNTVSSIGLYRNGTGTSAALNWPHDSFNGTVEVVQGYSSIVQQIAISSFGNMFMRYMPTSTTWTKWMEIGMSTRAGTLSGDLNDLSNGGTYDVNYVAATSVNFPAPTRATLQVISNFAESLVYQYFIPVVALGTYAGRKYYRTRNSGTWSSWSEEATSTNLLGLMGNVAGIGTSTTPFVTDFDWQQADFVTGTLQAFQFTSTLNQPSGIVYNTGTSQTIQTLQARGNLFVVKMVPLTSSTGNRREYTVVISGAKGSRIFYVTQDYNSDTSTIIPVSNGGTGSNVAATGLSNLGGYAQRATVATNANNLLDGVTPVSSSASNMPRATAGVIYQFTRVDGLIFQEYTGHSDGSIARRYIRVAWNQSGTTTWGSWTLVYTAVDKPTAADVGALSLPTANATGDANNFLSAGVYSIPSTITNLPIAANGVMTVTTIASGTAIIQDFSSVSVSSATVSRAWRRQGNTSGSVTTWKDWMPITMLPTEGSTGDLNTYTIPGSYLGGSFINGPSQMGNGTCMLFVMASGAGGTISHLAQYTSSNRTFTRTYVGGSWNAWAELYSSNNTTVDANGFIKKASPIVKMFADGTSELNDESEGATTKRLSEGVYRIDGVLGLNSDTAWSGTDGGFELPLDRNKQPKLWLDYDVESDGSIIVKTYHRTHPNSPAFAQNNIEGYANGDPIDIPLDTFISVRVEMPEREEVTPVLEPFPDGNEEVEPLPDIEITVQEEDKPFDDAVLESQPEIEQPEVTPEPEYYEDNIPAEETE